MTNTDLHQNGNNLSVVDEVLQHYGVLGMKWGVRKDEGPSDPLNTMAERAFSKVMDVRAQIVPREFKYALKRALNNPDKDDYAISEVALDSLSSKGVLSTSSKINNAIESVGIEKHKAAVYDLNETDVKRLKEYTNAARFSRNINSYLATKEPASHKTRAEELKETLSKSRVNDTTVFRSTSIKFSFDGIAKKLDTMTEDELAKGFDGFSKNYKGKTFKENRVFSTSTSPNFAIDTWRKVNPNAAKSYNTYMVLNTKNCPGVLADGKTTNGSKLVNTRSNQEGILAPSRIRYDSLAWDKERQMFAIMATAMGDEKNG